MSRLWGGLASAAIALTAVAPTVVAGDAEGSRARCRFDHGVLTIRVPRGLGHFAEVERGDGGALVVATDAGVAGCAGGQATVTSTRKVLMLAPKHAKSVAAVSLRGGPLAPGLGAESTAPEIEVTVSLGDRFDVFFLLGRGRADRIQLGSRRRHGLANLNVRGDHARPDADVEVLGANRTIVLGRGGGDAIEGTGGKGTGRAFRSGQLWLVGAGGSDRLLAGRRSDLLTGGRGADLLAGRSGRDVLIGGRGRDRHRGGGGDDFIESRDGRRDRVACGGGDRDVVRRDRSDRLRRNCEYVTADRGRAAAAPSRFRYRWAGRGLTERGPGVG